MTNGCHLRIFLEFHKIQFSDEIEMDSNKIRLFQTPEVLSNF